MACPGVIVVGWLRVRSIKGRLTLLAVGLITASLLAAAFLLIDAERRSRETFESQLQDTARALSLVVDRQIAQAAAFNAALATSSALEAGDLAAFDARARAALAGLDAWIVLSDDTGQQFVNTLRPFGSPLPRDPEGVAETWSALKAGRFIASDLIAGAVANQPVLTVDSPVRIEGVVRYDLSYAFRPGTLRDLLMAQKLPRDWVATVVDRRFRIVARTTGGDAIVGKPAPPDFVAAVQAAREGVIETTSMDGVPSVAAYSRIEQGWTVAVVVPKADVDGDAIAALRLAAIGALAIIAAGSLAAFRVARSIARPNTRLAALAGALGDGKRVVFSPTGLDEIDAVGEALSAASVRLDDRERQLAESEERQRLAFQAAGIGTWDVNVLTGRRFWSDEFRAILGLPPGFAPDPAVFSAIIHPDDRERVNAAYARLFARGSTDRYAEEFRILRRSDGAERWVRTEGMFRRDAEGRAVRGTGIIADITEREQAARQQALLLAELNHRVKNTLANVQAIASRTALTTRDPDVFVEKLSARLQALARTHVILTDHHWDRVELRELLEAELSPFSGSGAVMLEGPALSVGAETAVSLSLLFHELATNAAKHGCLASTKGHLKVTWTLRPDLDRPGAFDLVWHETCPQAIRQPTTQGFGSRLLTHSLRSLGGGAVSYEAFGVVCRLEVRY